MDGTGSLLARAALLGGGGFGRALEDTKILIRSVALGGPVEGPERENQLVVADLSQPDIKTDEQGALGRRLDERLLIEREAQRGRLGNAAAGHGSAGGGKNIAPLVTAVCNNRPASHQQTGDNRQERKSTPISSPWRMSHSSSPFASMIGPANRRGFAALPSLTFREVIQG